MKHSIFILVFLMASFCLSAQTPQKRVKKSQSTDVSDVNNAADTGGVSKNIAVTDNSMNKNVTNASSSSDNGTGNNQLKRKKFMARPGIFLLSQSTKGKGLPKKMILLLKISSE